MKKPYLIIAIAFLIAATTSASAQKALKSDPAYLPIDETFDVGIAKPEVSVNLPKFLLNNALSEFDNGPDDPFAQAGINIHEIVKDVQLIRVMVIEAGEENREHVGAGVKALRKKLEANWISLVSVPEDGIGIYTISDASGESMAGLAMLISDGDDVIVGNVVGNVPIGKLAKIAAKMGTNNAELQKLIGQLMGAGAPGQGTASESSSE